MSNHNYQYGYIESLESLVRQTKIICEALDPESVIPNSVPMVLETAAQETQLGYIEDTTREAGMGLCQFDQIGFHDTKTRSVRFVQTIKDRFSINISLINRESLRYNPFLSLLFCRLKYKLVRDSIPDTVEGRWSYYKRWYNSYLGEAGKESYLENAEHVKTIIKEYEDE